MTARGETCNLALAWTETFCDVWFWQVEAKEKLKYFSFGNTDFLVSFLRELISV